MIAFQLKLTKRQLESLENEGREWHYIGDVTENLKTEDSDEVDKRITRGIPPD